MYHTRTSVRKGISWNWSRSRGAIPPQDAKPKQQPFRQRLRRQVLQARPREYFGLTGSTWTDCYSWDIGAGPQPLRLLPQHRRQSPPAGKIEQLPNLLSAPLLLPRRMSPHPPLGFVRRGWNSGRLRISTLRFSLVPFRASFNNRVFCFLSPRKYSSCSAAKYCSRECMSILPAPCFTPLQGLAANTRSVTFSFDPTRGLSVLF